MHVVVGHNAHFFKPLYVVDVPAKGTQYTKGNRSLTYFHI